MLQEDNIHKVLEDLYFPVLEKPVYVESRPGAMKEVPGRKALVNEKSGRVLSVVSDKYEVVHNKRAFELAQICSAKAFPTTDPDRWGVFRIEAAATGGHCHIDLAYHGQELAHSSSLVDELDEPSGASVRFDPFVRVTNSYNTTRNFSILFGLVRFKCKNGIVIWDESIKLSYAHTDRYLEDRIERQIHEAKFRRAFERYMTQSELISHTPVPAFRMRRIALAVLGIREPKELDPFAANEWERLGCVIDEIVAKYVAELGENGAALFNTLTDLATRPPLKKTARRFIHRESHELQRRVGRWLAWFSDELAGTTFDLEAYLANPEIVAQGVKQRRTEYPIRSW